MYRATITIETCDEDLNSHTTKSDFKLRNVELGKAIEEAAQEARSRAMDRPLNLVSEVKNVCVYVYPYDK